MKKKLFAGILATLMCVVCAVAGLTACSDNNDDKKETVKITEGVYDGTYMPTGQPYKQDNYIRFHEEGEIFEGKQTFYYHSYSGEGVQAQAMVKPILGVYEVLDEEITIKSWQSGSQRAEDQGGVLENRTADKTVVLKSLDGATEYCRTGWDTKENKLLGIPAVSADLGITVGNTMGVSTQYGNYCLLNVKDDRVDRGVELYTYYCDTDTVRNASLVIYHNGTYADNKVTGTETVTGTYTVSDSTYTLTAGTGATGGTLVTTSTGATFTPTGGTAITMSTTKQRETVQVYTGTGTLTGNTTESTLTVTLYDDGSAELTGMGNPIEGTWAEIDGAKAITLVGSDLYPETETDNDGIYYYFEINGVTVRTVSVPANLAVHTYSGSAMSGTYDEAILNLYADGTAVLDAQKVGSTAYPKVHAEGTYDGRTVTVNYSGTDLVLTIAENTEGEGYVVTGGAPLNVELTGTTAPAAKALYTYSGSAMSGTYDETILRLYADGTAVLDAQKVGSTAYPKVHAEGTYDGRTVTVTYNGTDLVLTIAENAEGDGYVVTGGAPLNVELTGTTAPEAGTPDNPPAPVVTTLYTLEGNATGYDQSGSTVDYPYALKLNDDYSFELILTNPSVGASLTAAKGIWEVLTSGENAGKYQLTISESSYFEVNSTLLVAVTYNSDYSAVKGLSVVIPAISSMYLSEATLTYSSVTTLATLTGTTTGQGQEGTVNYDVEMTLYSDGTFKLVYTSNDTPTEMATGTYVAVENSVNFTVTATVTSPLAFENEGTITLVTNLDGSYQVTGFTATIPNIGMTYSGNWITTINGTTVTSVPAAD